MKCKHILVAVLCSLLASGCRTPVTADPLDSTQTSTQESRRARARSQVLDKFKRAHTILRLTPIELDIHSFNLILPGVVPSNVLAGEHPSFDVWCRNCDDDLQRKRSKSINDSLGTNRFSVSYGQVKGEGRTSVSSLNTEVEGTEIWFNVSLFKGRYMKRYVKGTQEFNKIEKALGYPEGSLSVLKSIAGCSYEAYGTLSSRKGNLSGDFGGLFTASTKVDGVELKVETKNDGFEDSAALDIIGSFVTTSDTVQDIIEAASKMNAASSKMTCKHIYHLGYEIRLSDSYIDGEVENILQEEEEAIRAAQEQEQQQQQQK